MLRFINSNVELVCRVDDKTSTVFPRAKVYNSAGVLQATVSLSHVADGVYSGTWAGSASTGEYKVEYAIFKDNGFTTLSTPSYNFVVEDILLTESINTIKTNVDTVDTVVDAVKLKTDTIDWTDVTFIKDVEGGMWHRTGTQIKMYKSDNVTLVATFDLKKSDGIAAGESDDVYKRVRV